MNEHGLIKIATLCVLRYKNKFLLLKRFNEPNKGKYVPVGGKLKNYESPTQGVIRETFEETGIKIKNPKFYGILTETSPSDYNWISYIYSVKIDFIEPPVSNEGNLEWIDYNKIKNIPTPLTDHYVYKYILEEKRFIFNAEYDMKLNMKMMIENIEDVIIK